MCYEVDNLQSIDCSNHERFISSEQPMRSYELQSRLEGRGVQYCVHKAKLLFVFIQLCLIHHIKQFCPELSSVFAANRLEPHL